MSKHILRTYRYLCLSLLLSLAAACGPDDPSGTSEEEMMTPSPDQGVPDEMGEPPPDMAADMTPASTLCAEDERVVGGECIACPPGTTNMAGDDVSAYIVHPKNHQT